MGGNGAHVQLDLNFKNKKLQIKEIKLLTSINVFTWAI